MGSTSVLTVGSVGSDVTQLQQQLASAGYYQGAIDGSYGPVTKAAHEAFRDSQGAGQPGPYAENPAIPAATSGSMATVLDPQTQQAPAQTQPTTTQQTTTQQQPLSGGGGGSTSLPSTTITQGGSTAAPTPNINEQTAPAPTPNISAETAPAPKATVTEPVQGQVTSPGTVKAPITEQTIPLDFMKNPYLSQLENMEFNYHALMDPDYIEAASGLENTVAQALVGRGGLYSSVVNSALQSNLASLQNQMRERKYQEFMQERSFTLSMAQYYSGLQSEAWQQQMQETQFSFQIEQAEIARQQFEAEFALAVDKERFVQEATIADFNLNRLTQEFAQDAAVADFKLNRLVQQYNQQLATAQHNLDRQIAAFNQEMQRKQLALQQQAQANAERARREAYNLQLRQVQAQEKQAQAVEQHQQQRAKLETDYAMYQSTAKKNEDMLARWKSSNTGADTTVSRHFGVPVGFQFNEGFTPILAKTRSLETQGNRIISTAYDLRSADVILAMSGDLLRQEEQGSEPPKEPSVRTGYVWDPRSNNGQGGWVPDTMSIQ